MSEQTQPAFDYVVIGLGLTGMSCARFLARSGVTFAITDSRDIPPGLQQAKNEFPQAAIHCGALDRDLILSAKICVVSPGVSVNTSVLREAQERGVEIIGDIELFARTVTAPVIAITGANGKSTVTTLVYEMAKASGLNTLAGGNLGTPALDLLSEPSPDLYVLELSSFQLETTHSLQPVAATVLNISEDHMDRYADLGTYAAAKARVFHGDGVMVINADDAFVKAMTLTGRDSVQFSLNAPSDENAYGLITDGTASYLAYKKDRLLAVDEMKIQGRHNVANALAAIALGAAADLPMTAMLSVLKSWPGLPHRCAWVAEKNGVVWYNDSKGTNEGATVAAIEGFADRGPIILIAGGDAKGATFEMLAVAAEGRVKHAILIGRDAALIEKVLASVCRISRAGNMQDAVKQAAQAAVSGDQVLMSPACASLDMYPNYLARGEDFRRCVEAEVVS